MIARIGMVNYINVAPIYEVWKESINERQWQVIEAQPSRLNRLLAADELDLGFVSSYEYAARPHLYRILADLSISATGPVGSVFLFATVPPAELHDSLVLLTGQSDTSVCLTRLVLEEFYGIRPRYTVGDALRPSDSGPGVQAVLAIGDDALRLKRSGIYPHCLDLGEAWHRQTGLPFVFAVCAVRQTFLDRHPTEARAIHAALIRCREEGARRLPEICDRVAKRIPMDCDACSSYLHAIEHDLSPIKQQALEQFFALLVRREEADPKAIPLRIFK